MNEREQLEKIRRAKHLIFEVEQYRRDNPGKWAIIPSECCEARAILGNVEDKLMRELGLRG